MACDWHVGQRVVCVDDTPLTLLRIVSGTLKKRDVYTIRDIIESVGNHPSEVGLILEEIEVIGPWRKCGFRPRRFRPVVRFKNDISVFTSILDRVNKREVVDA